MKNNKLLLYAITLALFGLFILSIGSVLAAPTDTAPDATADLLGAGTCPSGRLVVNVTLKVTGDVVTGTAGNNWAFTNYNRSVQVWRVATDQYCAVVKDSGTFTTIEGMTPNASTTVTLTAGINGTFSGGYRTDIFAGTLITKPVSPAKGFIGTFPYKCDKEGVCTGNKFDWAAVYFEPDAIFTTDWMSYTYRTSRNGTWTIYKADGNPDVAYGDIVPATPKPTPTRKPTANPDAQAAVTALSQSRTGIQNSSREARVFVCRAIF